MAGISMNGERTCWVQWPTYCKLLLIFQREQVERALFWSTELSWLLGMCSVGMHHFSVSIGVLDLPHLAAWLWEKSLLCMHFTCTEVFFCQGKWSKVVLWKRVQSQVLRWKIHLALEAVLYWKLVILGKLTFLKTCFLNYLFAQGISHEE